MALNLKALTRNLASSRTFEQVSKCGALCGEIECAHHYILSGKPGLESVQVVKKFYYYLGKLWTFTFVNEHNHKYYMFGELQQASWKVVGNN